MICTLGTIFVGLIGLAFGSFLNVCLSRWPAAESVVEPRSHCRHCSHVLDWWENIPLASWLILRGRCSACRAWIGWRYPLVELVVGALWTLQGWHLMGAITDPLLPAIEVYRVLTVAIGQMVFFWLIAALAVLDAEHLWLPDWITLPGAALGFSFRVAAAELAYYSAPSAKTDAPAFLAITTVLGAFGAAALVLLIRWVYWLLRRREGIGLGDAKLMALLAAWLGFPNAILSFGLGVVMGAIIGLVVLAYRIKHDTGSGWALEKLPLGTFLCIGGALGALWGKQIIAAYRVFVGI